MTFHSGTAGLFLLAAGALQAQAPQTATHVTADQIQTFLKALPRGATTDKPIRTVDTGGYRVGVFGVFRPKAGVQEAVLHETNVTEIYYMPEGSGTLTTGGTIPRSQRVQTPNGYANQRGPKIESGVSRHVVKGDVVIIPGRTPHWWAEMASDLSYLVCRPDPDGKTLTLQ